MRTCQAAEIPANGLVLWAVAPTLEQPHLRSCLVQLTQAGRLVPGDPGHRLPAINSDPDRHAP
eukprot:10609536-Alexandrium_andersonii.AAC.1